MSDAALVCDACGVRLVEIAADYWRCWLCGRVWLIEVRS